VNNRRSRSTRTTQRIGTRSTEETRGQPAKNRRTDLCVEFGVWDCYNSWLGSVAKRRQVETENPSACTTVNCKWCKWAIMLYCLYVSVFKCACVTQLLINPIFRTRTSLISGVYHYTRHRMFSAQVVPHILGFSCLKEPFEESSEEVNGSNSCRTLLETLVIYHLAEKRCNWHTVGLTPGGEAAIPRIHSYYLVIA
jgi:hypothetical protein